MFFYNVLEQFSTIIRQQKDKTQDFLWSCLRQIHFERSTDAGRKTSITHRHKNTMEHKHTTTQTQSQRHSMLNTCWISINNSDKWMCTPPTQPSILSDPYMWLPRGALLPLPPPHYFQKLLIHWLSETMRKIPGQKLISRFNIDLKNSYPHGKTKQSEYFDLVRASLTRWRKLLEILFPPLS